MKRAGKWLFFCCLFLVCAWKVYDKLVDGFYLYRTYPSAGNSLPQSSHLIQSFDELKDRVEQPFTYLASGSQSFVFVSADRTLVLKLFKHYRWRPFSYLPWRVPHRSKASIKQEEGAMATYQSSLFCMEELQKETGLLYLQLQPITTPLPTITIHNRLGKRYLLPLHSTSFALQRYAEPVTTHLLHLKQLQQHEIAKKHLEKLFYYLLERRSRGLTDKDPNFLNNFGFIGETPISIDIGGLIRDPQKDTHYFCSKELKKISKTLLPWLHKHYPELSSRAIELIEEVKHIAQQGTNPMKDLKNVTIQFHKATTHYEQDVLQWLKEPHVQEFWDNSLEHQQDIILFMKGRQEPSPYWNGIFDYWIGTIDNQPYCLLMTSDIQADQLDLSDLWINYLSKTGKTFSIDFMIGNKQFVGRGLGGKTLAAFTQFIHQKIDPSVDTFLIDPAASNPRAKHVYEKAGFIPVATFYRDSGEKKNLQHFLMVKQM